MRLSSSLVEGEEGKRETCPTCKMTVSNLEIRVLVILDST